MSEKFTLETLFESLKTKAAQNDKNSYTAILNRGGVEKITRKVGEEALEVVIASFINDKNNDAKNHQELTGEICDLFYHTMVLMINQKIEFNEILDELNKRNKIKKWTK